MILVKPNKTSNSKNMYQVVTLIGIILVIFLAPLLLLTSSPMAIITILLFIIYFFVFPNIFKYLALTPGKIAFSISMLVKYLLIPGLFLFTRNFQIIFGYSVAKNQIDSAWWMVIYEMTLVVFFFMFLEKRNKKINKHETVLSNEVNKNTMLISKIFTVIVIIFIMFNPETLNMYSFVFEGQRISTSDVVYNSNFVTLAVDYTRFLLPIIFITMFLNKIKNKKKLLEFLPILIIILISCSFYLKTSRNSALIPLLSFIFVLLKIFPKKKRTILLIMGSILIIMFFTLTIYKSFYDTNVVLADLTGYLSKYFMGPQELAIGIEAKRDFGTVISERTLLNDLFGNVPFFSRFFNPLNRSGQYFNYTYYSNRISSGGGLIIPSYIQGSFYIGYVFGPLFTLFNIFIFMKMDEVFTKKNNVLVSFVVARIAIQSALFFSYNVAILIGHISVWLIPLIFLDWLDKKIKI